MLTLMCGYQAKTIPLSLTFNPSFTSFATLSADRHVRIFTFLSAKKTRQYDESLQAIQDMQQAGTASYKLDDMEFGRRLATEKELEKAGVGLGSCAWDESGSFLLYPTMLGIKGAFVHLSRSPVPQHHLLWPESDRIDWLSPSCFLLQSSTRSPTGSLEFWARMRHIDG